MHQVVGIRVSGSSFEFITFPARDAEAADRVNSNAMAKFKVELGKYIGGRVTLLIAVPLE